MLASILLPPMGPLLMVAAGATLMRRAKRLGYGLIWSGLMVLWLLSLPATGRILLASLETAPTTLPDATEAQAIVVLGAGIHRQTPEYGGDTVRGQTLERLRYAARLHRQSGLPIMVTGGAPEGGTPEAEAMRLCLNEDFGVAVRWVEHRSENTGQNAQLSLQTLRSENIRHILLVTHSWHMRRAAATFRKAGFIVTPAPTLLTRFQPRKPLDWLPSAEGLQLSRTALHEWIGIVWYMLHDLA